MLILDRHCTGSDESESESASSCDSPSRDYNIGLRVGLLFVILATSALGVFGPILLHKVMPTKLNLLFTVLKQFGTGIIVSTAFIHVSELHLLRSLPHVIDKLTLSIALHSCGVDVW